MPDWPGASSAAPTRYQIICVMTGTRGFSITTIFIGIIKLSRLVVENNIKIIHTRSYIPTLITFVSYWLVGFPISWFLGKEEAFASFGIWLGLLAGLTTASILLYIRFNYLTKKLILQKEN